VSEMLEQLMPGSLSSDGRSEDGGQRLAVCLGFPWDFPARAEPSRTLQVIEIPLGYAPPVSDRPVAQSRSAEDARTWIPSPRWRSADTPSTSVWSPPAITRGRPGTAPARLSARELLPGRVAEESLCRLTGWRRSDSRRPPHHCALPKRFSSDTHAEDSKKLASPWATPITVGLPSNPLCQDTRSPTRPTARLTRWSGLVDRNELARYRPVGFAVFDRFSEQLFETSLDP
jgi:hypothetical protein